MHQFPETDLLLVLCQHAGQMLSREELISFTRGKNFPIAARSIVVMGRGPQELGGPTDSRGTKLHSILVIG